MNSTDSCVGLEEIVIAKSIESVRMNYLNTCDQKLHHDNRSSVIMRRRNGTVEVQTEPIDATNHHETSTVQ
jgi:hypothetical protein